MPPSPRPPWMNGPRRRRRRRSRRRRRRRQRLHGPRHGGRKQPPWLGVWADKEAGVDEQKTQALLRPSASYRWNEVAGDQSLKVPQHATDTEVVVRLRRYVDFVTHVLFAKLHTTGTIVRIAIVTSRSWLRQPLEGACHVPSDIEAPSSPDSLSITCLPHSGS
jgi:hypothetical protein